MIITSALNRTALSKPIFLSPLILLACIVIIFMMFSSSKTYSFLPTATKDENCLRPLTTKSVEQFSAHQTSSYPTIWDEAKSQQKFFCDRLFTPIKDILPTNYALSPTYNIKSGSFRLYAYQRSDTVSNFILKGDGWDMLKTDKMLQELEDVHLKKHIPKDQIVFVDIGANIGWFSITYASNGYKVYSFEPMSQNEIIMRSNICLFDPRSELNQWIYFNKGLGAERSQCAMISHAINVGDGHTKCTKSGKLKIPEGYTIRDTIDIVRLDDVITEEILNAITIGVVKVDVENFEKFVVEGGQQFFAHPKVNRLIIEFLQNTDSETTKRNHYVYDMLIKLGWKLSLEVFKGKEMDAVTLNGKELTDAYGWK